MKETHFYIKFVGNPMLNIENKNDTSHFMFSKEHFCSQVENGFGRDHIDRGGSLRKVISRCLDMT